MGASVTSSAGCRPDLREFRRDASRMVGGEPPAAVGRPEVEDELGDVVDEIADRVGADFGGA